MKIGRNTFELVNDKYYQAIALYNSHAVVVMLETRSPLVAVEIGDYVDRLLEDLPSILKRAEKDLLDSVDIGYHERMKVQNLMPNCMLLVRPDEEDYVEYQFTFSLFENGIVDSINDDLCIILGGNSKSEQTAIDITGDLC